ncbi:MAG: AAA family ATPase [Candidatus Marinimicrobia bacterium]|jgi:hypothetical protein|nr:AAA family ATPase [Candidatus Neomarinimicrobiota bacterium]
MDDDWEREFMMTQEELDEIADPSWLYRDLIIQGHVIVIVAPPNGGKTTIFEYIAAQIARDITKRVIYINADISGPDMKRSYNKAINGGYSLLTPDGKVGKSMDDVVKKLMDFNDEGENQAGRIYIFDTYKKMVNVINKTKNKILLKVLRSLSTKGATIILLGHTNKYPDSEGNYVYEGTGDVRADVDELIYLIPLKKDDGSMVVSTKPDKIRGDFKPITFNISPDRMVTQEDGFVDINYEKSLIENQEIASIIKMAIVMGHNHQASIIGFSKKEGGFSKRKVLDILKTFTPRMWTTKNIGENNKLIYELRD